MNITELDEWQGLTVAMLHSWLLSHGWRLAACEQGCGKELVSPYNRRCNVSRSLEDFAWSWALIETRMTAQALLREINPRMRKGVPSKAAQAAHAGHWIVSDSETGCLGIQQTHMLGWGDCSLFAYWPCDEHGNKVRWPVDAKGSML